MSVAIWEIRLIQLPRDARRRELSEHHLSKLWPKGIFDHNKVASLQPACNILHRGGICEVGGVEVML